MVGLDVILNALISGVLLGGMLALTALGLSIILGVMRLVNLAHGEFLVAGAYAGLFLLQWTGIDPLLGLGLIGIALALIGYPIYRFLLAPLAGKGPEASMMTMFGLSIILQNVFVLLFSADTRAIERGYATVPLDFGPISVPQIYVIGFCISAVLIAAVHVLITRSRFGGDLRASADQPQAAAIIGINVGRVHAITFCLGVACAGIGGTLIGVALSFTPTSGAAYLLTDFALIVLGGLGNVFGTLIGGVVIGMLQSLGGLTLGDGYRDLVALVLFLAVLSLRPQGMLGSRA
ncbi:branched-chain amino acid ABC transporter permease [Bradyrhizobium sp.]|uniref:branched-chain amino acid ABC transporter permease n=3 Tax=Bradyrhizobium sp. TaxID=376 RepID=UPI001EBE8FF9|nr:branched-chain amino acid ABC transporter permease [Bradyrhizobium sp.]MBV9982765.1 branched-chain amino acid ABC transporter permease [Bradyrhizobium sp.]